MQPIFSDPKGAKAMIAFVDSEDNAVFPAKLFGLDNFHYGNLKELAPTLVAIECFLNWNKFAYTVYPQEVTVARLQRALSMKQLDSLLTNGSYSQIENYWRYSAECGEKRKGRRRRRRVEISKPDGTKKVKFITSGTFVSDGAKKWLQLHADAGYTKVTLEGYAAKAENIRARVVVYRGKHRQAAGIADGGQLHQYFSPFEDNYIILDNGEAHPVSVEVGDRHHKTIIEKWHKEKAGWIITAQWIMNLSKLFDIPRGELMAKLAKDCKTGSPLEFMAAVKKFHKRYQTQHALEAYILLKDFYARLREEKHVHIKDWAAGLEIVKPADETRLRDKAAKCLYLAFKDIFFVDDQETNKVSAVTEAFAAKAPDHTLPMLRVNKSLQMKKGETYQFYYQAEKTSHLTAYDRAWQAFAADMRAMI